jgi:ubiquinone biosynthesis protein Coq4
MDDVPYLLRGVAPVESESSVLVSSSKYLNNLFLRDWLPMILLRKNGPDLPPPAEMHGFSDTLRSLRDLDEVERRITEERKVNPDFDAWFVRRHISSYTIDDFKGYASGTVGGVFYEWITQGNYDIQLRPWKEPKTQLDFYELRSGQTHDFEHIICGGEFSFVGELVPYWMRLSNLFVHLRDQALAGELAQIYIFGQLRYTVRTVLHYPDAWLACVDAIQRGIQVGRESSAIFMFDYEPVLHLPIDQARAALGVRGAIDRDTREAGEILAGRRPRAPAHA